MGKSYAQDGTLMLSINDATGKCDKYLSISGQVKTPESDLCEIAARNLTDKAGNGYTYFYDTFFSAIRNSVKDVLEIGISAGYSLQMWKEYFPNALIHGIDNGVHKDKHSELNRMGRIVTIVGDQDNKNDMVQFGKEFDLICDDGSHKQKHQQQSLAWLFPYVKSNGYYIVEDICAVRALCNDSINWGQRDRVTGSDSTALFLSNALNDKWQSEYLTEDELEYLRKNVEWVQFCFGCSKSDANPFDYGGPITCLLKKKAGPV